MQVDTALGTYSLRARGTHVDLYEGSNSIEFLQEAPNHSWLLPETQLVCDPTPDVLLAPMRV